MAVRITFALRQGEQWLIGRSLRSRFSFRLIRAPQRRPTTLRIDRLDVSERRIEIRSEPMTVKPARPPEEELELSLLLRGHPVAPRA